jgi:hypothetical protein
MLPIQQQVNLVFLQVPLMASSISAVHASASDADHV